MPFVLNNMKKLSALPPTEQTSMISLFTSSIKFQEILVHLLKETWLIPVFEHYLEKVHFKFI